MTTEKRWKFSICSHCDGIIGLVRGLPASCTCERTHAKIGRTTPEHEVERGAVTVESIRRAFGEFMGTVRSSPNPESDEVRSTSPALTKLFEAINPAPTPPNESPASERVEGGDDA